ncbi:hypothetical protein [Gimesia panareensis]|uniref:hypothetical protein n=1 Tax=Gimesia panareensis TaxID=2527978 RepID=UPI00118D35F9|nr:hypothetical protein [Gimesia panareensis]QDU50907.1 hypothetical protein Pan110_32680 [Gimesia panareensis]
MQTYKKMLLQKLTDNGWEMISQSSACDWWLEEYWTIKSVRNHWGLELLVLFLVDPQFEGQHKNQGVRSITVTTEMPSDWIAAENGLALITIIGSFEKQADHLLETINYYRSTATD